MVTIEKDTGDGFRFLLKSEAGQTLLRSICFPSEADANLSLQNLKQEKKFERKTDHEGKFLFNLWDGQGRLLGQSERYSSEAGMENGIKNLQSRINLLPDKGFL
ncbi:MAG: DUF1508 domain-containing protein [Bacteroidota bacterium]